jgi:hypothetical protein
MFNFFKKSIAQTSKIKFTQLDITENFGDNLRLKPDDWIETIPLSKDNPNPTQIGLPARDATDEEIYAIGKDMSSLREQIRRQDDGVYCPICHIANIQLNKIDSPCPKCNRLLLRFGWD